MFITLSSTVTGLPVLVNVKNITHFYDDDRGFCVLKTANGGEINTHQSAETVMKLIEKEEAYIEQVFGK